MRKKKRDRVWVWQLSGALGMHPLHPRLAASNAIASKEEGHASASLSTLIWVPSTAGLDLGAKWLIVGNYS